MDIDIYVDGLSRTACLHACLPACLPALCAAMPLACWSGPQGGRQKRSSGTGDADSQFANQESLMLQASLENLFRFCPASNAGAQTGNGGGVPSGFPLACGGFARRQGTLHKLFTIQNS